MSHPHKEHGVLAGFAGSFVHGPAGMLFQDVVNMLHARDIALANAVDSFIEPADGRPKGDAVVADLSRALQLLQSRPKRVVSNLLHPDVVKLKKIDPICFQTF